MHRKQLEQHNYQHLSRLFRIELFYPGAVSVRLLCIFNKTNWNARAEEIPYPGGEGLEKLAISMQTTFILGTTTKGRT